MTKQETLNIIHEKKAVAVLRIQDEEKLTKVINAIAEGGITIAEITMTVPNALKKIEKISAEMGDKILVGVGSVLNGSVAEDAIKAGAKFVVSPILKKEIIEVSHKYEIPVMPGCFTPTEIQTAYEYGADIIKVFPADVLGMEYFRSVLAPMPHLKLMPTGGVTLDNVGDWIKSGACAVGIGSALLDKHAIQNGNYFILTENAKKIVNSINSVNR